MSTIELASHQRAMYRLMLTQPFAGVWLGVGGGKTLATLKALEMLRPAGHMLVIAPGAIARSTWLDEIAKYNFRVRTRSLIVDENDRKLPKTERLRRFQQVLTDPPTMYFINQEMLTQPSNAVSTWSLVEGADLAALEPEQRRIVDLLMQAPIGALVDQATRLHEIEPSIARTRIQKHLSTLRSCGVLACTRTSCPRCKAKGCADCSFGLIDQMPVQTVNGRPSRLWPFPTVIIDESQEFKSHSAARFKALASVRPAITRLIELTGTPAPNGLHDLWSQMYLLDQGAALGKNITAFRDRWFDPITTPGTPAPIGWKPRPGATEEIHEAISHLVMSAQNTELVLPKLHVEHVNITLPGETMQAYRDLRRDLVLEIVGPALRALEAAAKDDGRELTETERHDCVHTVVAENQAVLTSKLMQFASGTLYTSDPDDPSTKGRFTVVHEQKLQMASYLIRNNGGSPVLLAYQFRSDAQQLMEHLNGQGVAAELFDGSRDCVRRWNAGQIPVLLVHPASAGPGLNLQSGGHTMIWYTMPFSLKHWMQTNGRLHRPGQQHPVTIYCLIAAGTHDARIPGLLGDKGDLQQMLIDAVDVDSAPTEPAAQQGADALMAEFADDLTDTLLTPISV